MSAAKYACIECEFQGVDAGELARHIHTAHPYAMRCNTCGGGVTHKDVAEWVQFLVEAHRGKKELRTEVGWPREWTPENAKRHLWKWYWICHLEVDAYEDEDGYFPAHDCGARCCSESDFVEHVHSQHVHDWVECKFDVEHDSCYRTAYLRDLRAQEQPRPPAD